MTAMSIRQQIATQQALDPEVIVLWLLERSFEPEAERLGEILLRACPRDFALECSVIDEALEATNYGGFEDRILAGIPPPLPALFERIRGGPLVRVSSARLLAAVARALANGAIGVASYSLSKANAVS